jgi:hypothetical protein
VEHFEHVAGAGVDPGETRQFVGLEEDDVQLDTPAKVPLREILKSSGINFEPGEIQEQQRGRSNGWNGAEWSFDSVP